MEYAMCIVPVAPVRREPSHKAEMVNQLLFGERMQLLDQKEDWLSVRSLYDGYEGWVTVPSISSLAERDVRKEADILAGDLLNVLHNAGDTMHIPMGSELNGYNDTTGYLWDHRYLYKGHFITTDRNVSEAGFRAIARSWVNAPYLWGGKTILGVDCSGYVQTVFKVLGIPLLRDAYQQAEQGEKIEDLELAQPGDLAFFHNEKGRITHVGFIWDKGTIIHASGCVRIDQLNHEGIWNRQTEKLTHHLHSVRRITRWMH